MTRRNIVLKTKDGKLYVTPEFNGDKREYELKETSLGVKSVDSYSKNWEEVLKDFEGITTLEEFERASKQAQEYGTSFLGYIDILPVEEISKIEDVQNDEVYLIKDGVLRKL